MTKRSSKIKDVQRHTAIMDDLMNGTAVAVAAMKHGISVSTVYKLRNTLPTGVKNRLAAEQRVKDREAKGLASMDLPLRPICEVPPPVNTKPSLLRRVILKLRGQ